MRDGVEKAMAGHQRDKRRTTRITCSLPVRIRTRSGWVTAEVTDVSRTGLRLRLADEAVGLTKTASLLEVARRLGGMLPEDVETQFGAGQEVTRHLRVVRIGKRSRTDASVQLGCLLETPFSDEEAAVLDLILPKPGETWEQAERRVRTAQQTS